MRFCVRPKRFLNHMNVVYDTILLCVCVCVEQSTDVPRRQPHDVSEDASSLIRK